MSKTIRRASFMLVSLVSLTIAITIACRLHDINTACLSIDCADPWDGFSGEFLYGVVVAWAITSGVSMVIGFVYSLSKWIDGE